MKKFNVVVMCSYEIETESKKDAEEIAFDIFSKEPPHPKDMAFEVEEIS